jgi:hypothetical protein
MHVQWYLGIRPLWNKSNLIYVLFGREKFVWYTTFVWNTTRVRQNESRHKAQTSRNSIAWNDQTVSHFRNILRRRQKQSSLDRFLLLVPRNFSRGRGVVPSLVERGEQSCQHGYYQFGM